MNAPTTEQIAARLERAARIAAPFIALVITVALLLVQLAYDLGRLTGDAVHARSAQLAAVHVRLLGATPQRPAPSRTVPDDAEPSRTWDTRRASSPTTGRRRQRSRTVLDRSAPLKTPAATRPASHDVPRVR